MSSLESHGGLQRRPVYLDNAATTRMDPRVLETMLPFFCERYGNPGSRVYGTGLDAEAAVQTARRQVASLLGVSPLEVLFTSGATESNNLALSGTAEAWGHDCDLIVSEYEHPSVLMVAERLAERGCRLVVLPVNPAGWVEPETLRGFLADPARNKQTLVSIMHANNETGTINPIAELSEICHEYGALIHCDATQSVGKIPVDVRAMQIDMLSLSAHKVYGPMGVGALVLRRQRNGLPLAPMVVGGGQERGLRSGTLNVPGIVGLGAAAQLVVDNLAAETEKTRQLSESLVKGLQERLSGVQVNGSFDQRVPGTINLSIAGVSGEEIQQAIRATVEISIGSACSTGHTGASHVMVALGVSLERALSAIRLALGRFTTEAEIQQAIATIVTAARRLRGEDVTSDQSAETARV